MHNGLSSGEISSELIGILLIDRTTGENIVWGTTDYCEYGCFAVEEIQLDKVELIRSRYEKIGKRQRIRTRDRAEIFTPSWLCNEQNNLVDEAWFGRAEVFNTIVDIRKHTWQATPDKIVFSGELTWHAYVEANRLEITCGEAPYLVSRYDSVTGEPIEISQRIGLLDRKLRVIIAESASISARAGKTDDNDRIILGEFLNFCPIISVEGSQMRELDTNKLLQQLKRAYAERVVLNGFDDVNLYNDALLRLDDLEIEKFQTLNGIVGSSKAQQKTKNIDINAQGFTEEEYEAIKRAERKPPRERTPEETALLEEVKRKNKLKADAISNLRAISIRMPLLIYGADVPVDEDFKIEMLFDDKIVDRASWEEFMPTGVTKELFLDFIKYYDPEIFIGAGHRIRNLAQSADELPPTERVKKIAELFSTFKNPDKETVLTPWRVVNLHMSDCLGGWNFFDESHENILETPRFVDSGRVMTDTLANINAKILEINSKTGLYPLYVTYSIYRARLGDRDEKSLSLDELRQIWDATVAENIFVICKTPMAKAITKRTLVGFRNSPVNAHYFDDLINYLRNKQEKFIERILKESYWKKGGGRMKFDAVVGNPPYQIMDNGAQASAKPIYNHFVEAGKKLDARYMSFIIPSRWYAGGKGLDLFRDSMLADKHLEKLFDCLTPEYIFPNTNIRSGVCWFLRNKDFDNKKDLMRVVTIDKNVVIDDVRRPLKVEGAGIFIRHAQAISILNKVKVVSSDFMDSWISPRKPFGIESAFSQTSDFKEKADELHDIKCLGKGFKVGYINRSQIG